ncbi:aquaporin-1-like [Clytia hemisphaerica]|uniref:Aquaporin n=1 Tax=Clytia hemisphaerica TaxID=252671 RepID=A0A7M5V250_9CNID|eukprot:TCONS_00031628-protein
MVTIDLGLDEIGTFKFWRAVLAEGLGCVLFLLCVTCVALPWDNAGTNESANNVEIGIGIGLSIASIAQAFGHVSGGHLNPAVTFAMMLSLKISVIKGLLYIVAQIVGGIIGSALTYACTNDQNRSTLGVTSPRAGVTAGQGFGLELLFTFLLVFTVFSITDPKKKTEPYGTTLGIGVVIWVCHVCLIPFTGCGINPTRSFGPAVVMNSWQDHWIYWIGPLLGGALAAIFYNFLFYVEEETPVKYVVKDAPNAAAQDGVKTDENNV